MSTLLELLPLKKNKASQGTFAPKAAYVTVQGAHGQPNYRVHIRGVSKWNSGEGSSFHAVRQKKNNLYIFLEGTDPAVVGCIYLNRSPQAEVDWVKVR